MPKGVLHKIESMLSKFLWSGKIDQRKLHPISWNTVCKPKKGKKGDWE
uniref:Uncharacterized protein n=1 Tax=Vitis vinifera TaxID=29760 RepID=A5BK63_VITVI|nr:hypothetical protein VITISV_029795 [Vitis vinifera]